MDQKDVLHRYLKSARQALLWKLEGLADYDLRRPLTATGTNLLGVLKHVASVEMGYFTSVFNRPCDVPLPWFDEGAEPNADMWATAEETRDDIVACSASPSAGWLAQCLLSRPNRVPLGQQSASSSFRVASLVDR